MNESAIVKWLKEEFFRRFRDKASEGLTTLIWFDPDRYWLPSMSRLMEMAAHWSLSWESSDPVPMRLVAVGGDIPGLPGRSPLETRLAILQDRMASADHQGIRDWQRMSLSA